MAGLAACPPGCQRLGAQVQIRNHQVGSLRRLSGKILGRARRRNAYEIQFVPAQPCREHTQLRTRKYNLYFNVVTVMPSRSHHHHHPVQLELSSRSCVVPPTGFQSRWTVTDLNLLFDHLKFFGPLIESCPGSLTCCSKLAVSVGWANEATTIAGRLLQGCRFSQAQVMV